MRAASQSRIGKGCAAMHIAQDLLSDADTLRKSSAAVLRYYILIGWRRVLWISSTEVFDMKLSRLRMRLHGVACVLVASSLLAACGSSDPTPASTSSSGSSSS